jgi:DNA-binding CsgD family transcriptional regulator
MFLKGCDGVVFDSIESLLALISPRERQVLVHLAKGHTYWKTAHHMRLSPHTVDTYIRRIRAKTGVTNRAQLMALAMSTAGRDMASVALGTGNS